MSLRFRADARATAAIEFAMLAPFLCTAAVGCIGFGIALWTWNALQTASLETARCLAIGSSACKAVTAGCDSAVPGICYAEKLAAMRGISGLTASAVAVNATASYGSGSFTSVTITYPVAVLGYSITLTGSGAFPNN